MPVDELKEILLNGPIVIQLKVNAHMGACSLRISNANEEEKRFIIHGFIRCSKFCKCAMIRISVYRKVSITYRNLLNK